MTSSEARVTRHRTCFARQPARLLLVDLCPPFDSTTYQIVAESLSHFLALACSLPGPCRLPFFGLQALGTYPEMLYPLQSVRGNYSRLRSALAELEICMNNTRGAAGSQSTLGQGVREAASAFKRQSNNMMQMAGYWTQLELTVLTCQNPTVAVGQVDQAVADLSLDVLKKAQIVHLNIGNRATGPQDRTTSSQGSNESTHTSNESESMHTMVECLTLDEDSLSLENFFKGWLRDASTDVEHLHLIMSSEPGSELVIKCDLHERLLSPSLLPAADILSIQCDGTVPGRTPGVAKGANSTQLQVPVYHLQAVRRVQTEGVCESVLYGMPVIVRPTSCWKIDWDDLETNQQHFNALCRLLKEKDEYLMVVTAPHPKAVSTSAFRYQVAPPVASGYFLMMPSSGGSMLLKAAGVSALTLPADLPPSDDVPDGSIATLGHALSKLEVADTYNPLLVTSGLYQCLDSNLTKNQQTATATKRKFPVSVIKPASSLPGYPVGQATGNQSGNKQTWDRNQTTPSLIDKRHHHQMSGREFYSGSDFPSEL